MSHEDPAAAGNAAAAPESAADDFVDPNEVPEVIAVDEGAPAPDDPAGETLTESRLVLVAAPDFAGRAVRDLADLAALHAVVIADPHPRRDWPFRRGGETRRVRAVPRHLVTDVDAARTLVRAGAGVTLLPDWFVAGDIARGDLAILLPEWTAPSYPVRAIALAPRLAKVERALDWLRGKADAA